MKRRLFGCCTILLGGLLYGSATVARDMDGQFAVFGVGGEDCATYLVARDRAGELERRYHQWLAGYLSAVNNAGASTYNILGAKTMADMIGLLYADRHNIAPGKEGGWNKVVNQASSPPAP